MVSMVLMGVSVIVVAMVVMGVSVNVVAMVVIGFGRNTIAFKQSNTHQERQGNISFDGMKDTCIFFDTAQAFF